MLVLGICTMTSCITFSTPTLGMFMLPTACNQPPVNQPYFKYRFTDLSDDCTPFPTTCFEECLLHG
nr:hypothetical protein Q903MT_gene6184 [Picea sitchensis]